MTKGDVSWMFISLTDEYGMEQNSFKIIQDSSLVFCGTQTTERLWSGIIILIPPRHQYIYVLLNLNANIPRYQLANTFCARALCILLLEIEATMIE
jgi:hypothetical protein